jgi:pimeloyl-ACP methyl ester carboxylesterase
MRDRKDRTFVLSHFRKKKLIIAGVDDLIVPISEAQHVSEVTKTPLTTIAAGHMSWIENNAAMLKAMGNFLHSEN